jgi:acyl-coenzyme A synthetase/AMP-(fatty) acid ligase/acyl carrier protein
MTGGEACSPGVIAAWAPGRRFFNLYGPTECTVLVTARRMAPGDDPKQLGHSIPGMRLYVVDDDGRQASRGELLVAGVQVSNGYISNPEATADRFVCRPELDAEILYRTGDIVERDDDGGLRFIGRKDRQVKIRGFRVELEEIEGALVELGCTEAAVVVSPRATLMAYVSCSDALSLDTLSALLSARLHAFKVPEHMVRLPRLPRKPSGKIDYHQLPAYAPNAMSSESAHALSEFEDAVAQVWSEILEIEVHTIGREANFRTLGGTSIDIVHLVVALEERFGLRLSFIDVFEQPTLAYLTEQLTTHKEKSCFQP